MPGVKTVKCSGCQAQPVSGDLFNHWQRNGHQMISVEGKLPDFFNMACGCIADKRLSGVHSALMHGLRDERSGEDALYLLLRPEQPFTKRERRMFGLLLPQIDHACRRVVAGDGSQVCSDSPPGALPAVAADDSGLSGREMEIMSWVRAGKTNHEIGMILDISAFTVKNHLQRIFRKINVTNRAQAVSKFEGIGRPR
jgi:transcriptional regulator EpsA